MKRIAIVTLSLVFILGFFAVAFAGTGHECADGSKGKDCPQAKMDQGKMDHAKADAADAPKVFDSAQPVGAKATCPVMGNALTVSENTPHSEFKGKHVYFCCPGCKPQFDAEPEKFLPKEK